MFRKPITKQAEHRVRAYTDCTQVADARDRGAIGLVLIMGHGVAR